MYGLVGYSSYDFSTLEGEQFKRLRFEQLDMDSIDGVVYIHGYATEGFDAQLQSNERVWESRVTQAISVCELFDSLGVSVELVFLGGVDDEHGSNAERMQSYARQEYGSRVEKFDQACVYEREVDTEREVELAYSHSREVGASFAVSVSNYDHTPRIDRLWSRITESDSTNLDVFVSSSDDKYSNLESISDEANPLILEGAVFEPIIGVFDDELWNVNTDDYDEIAADIRDVFQKYQD